MLPAQLCRLWRAEEETGKHRHSRGPVHPLAPRCRESAALLWPRQGHRDSSAFVPYFGKWAPGASGG